MKQFACGMMIPGCDALWVCASEEEILTQAARHAAEDHQLGGDGALVERVRSFIATAA
jgi:predicted small metal-binding protein